MNRASADTYSVKEEFALMYFSHICENIEKNIIVSLTGYVILYA